MSVDAFAQAYAAKQYADEYDYVAEHEWHLSEDFEREHDKYAAIELARYLVWLGAQGGQVDAKALAVFTLACVRRGRWWSEVAEDLGLPVPSEWEL